MSPLKIFGELEEKDEILAVRNLGFLKFEVVIIIEDGEKKIINNGNGLYYDEV